MSTWLELTLAVATFGLTLWFGSYLLGRDIRNVRLQLSGSGLIVYSLGLGCLILYGDSGQISDLCRLLFVVPAILWTGAVVALLPDDNPWRPRLLRLVLYAQLPATLIIFLLVEIAPASASWGTELLAAVVLLPFFGSIVYIFMERGTIGTRRTFGLLILGLLLFSFSTIFLLIPLLAIPTPLIIFGMGLDMLILGFAVTMFDAFEQGEVFARDLLRSFTAAFIYAAIFASVVIVTAAAGPGISFWMILLLLSVVAVAILSQTLAYPLYNALDRLVFAQSPAIEQERGELRGVAEAASRLDQEVRPEKLSDAELMRLTRKAISQFGNLPKLAANPLVQLPLIDHRLHEKGRQTSTLERATELKELLSEAILQLKPRGDERFGETDEWRFFNALYYPYVAGLKPYSRRINSSELDEESRMALNWFQTQVPERTLHNWQNSAAGLVASYIKELENLSAEVSP